MSTADNGTGKAGSVKTLAIRLEADLHAQLSLIAQLRSSTITDEIRQAIDAHIAAVKASPELAVKADDIRADIEREAAARRDAIATLFGSEQTSDNVNPASRNSSSRTKGNRSGGDSA